MDSSDDDFDSLPVLIRGSGSAVKAVNPDVTVPPEEQQHEERPTQKAVTFNFNDENHDVSADSTRYSTNGQDSGYQQDLSVFESSNVAQGEDFQPAEQAEFMDDLDFLEGRGNDDRLASERQAALARQSLYTKFDPLVGNPAEAARSRLSELNRREDPFVQCPEPSDDLSSLKISDERQSANQSQDQSPGIDLGFSPLRKQPQKVERQSQATSVASAASESDSQLVEPLLYTQSDLDAVIMARSEDLQKKNEELQAKLKSDRVAVGGKEEKLRNELNEMKRIVGEYEKTIVSLTENSQRDTMAKDETLSDLIKEKEQLRVDLNTAESGLLDAYRRVETLNKAVESYRANEGQLKASIDNHKGLLQRSEERYEKLKKHAEEKLDFANKEIGKVRKSKEVDLAGLEATVKKWQAKAATLEQSLNQKVTENEELTKICDDLISRVSSQGN